MPNKDVALLDRISRIMSEIGTDPTKSAATTDTSIGGTSSHETVNAESGEVEATEGSQTADNTKYNKENNPKSPDTTPDATLGSETTQSELQHGDALPTGEWAEDKPKDRPSDVPTDAAADASVGPKNSADLEGASIDDLLKMAEDLGNNLSAAMATGFLTEDEPTQPRQAQPKADAANKAAAAGEVDAATVAQAEEKIATEVIETVVKSAYDRADMTAQYITALADQLQKEAVGVDPTSEDVADPTVAPAPEAEAGAEGEIDEATLAALIEALGAEGPEGAAPAEVELPPEGEVPVEGPVGDDAEAEALLEAMAGPGGEEVAPEAPPEELAGMDDETALLELLAALEETGDDEQMLGKMGGDVGAYLSKSASEVRNAGKFKYKSAKRGSAERKVRDYMKSYIKELYRRNR